MRVIVDGWANPRQIIEEAGKVLFEIGLGHGHCSTCASRHRYVEQALSRKGLKFDYYTASGGQVYVVLPAPFKEDVRSYVGRMLDLPIRN